MEIPRPDLMRGAVECQAVIKQREEGKGRTGMQSGLGLPTKHEDDLRLGDGSAVAALLS